jgi:diamine N-acetyltransferase
MNRPKSNPLEILEGKNIKLRAVEPEDADLIYKWENDSSIWHASNTIEPFSYHIIKKYAENAHLDLFQAKQLRLMIDIQKDNKTKTVGSIDLFNYDPMHQRAGVGILVHANEDRKKGYAGDALQTLISYAFGVLMLHQLYCNIDEDNEASLKLFKKYGFKITGKKHDWIRTSLGYKNEYFLQLINSKLT